MCRVALFKERIYVILFFLLLYTNEHSAQSILLPLGEDSTLVYEMSEIVVTGKRPEVVKGTTFNEITASELAKLDIKAPGEALKFAPGVHVYKISTNETVFMLRGFEQRQVSVFLDGVPISVPYDGKVDLSQFIGDNWQSIRLARGVASALYGANTLGGIVNIISSANPAAHRFTARLEGQTYGAYFINLNYKNRFGNLNYDINITQEASPDIPLSKKYTPAKNENGGTRDNSAYNKKGLAIKLYYRFDENHRVGFRWHYLDNWYHIPPNSKTERVRYWRFPEWKRNVMSLNSTHRIADMFKLRTVFFYDVYYNVLESYDDASYTSQTKRYAWKSTYDDYSLGFNIYPTANLWKFGATRAVLSYKTDTHREAFREFDFSTYRMSTLTVGVEQDINLNHQHLLILGSDVNYLKPIQADGTAALRSPILLWNGQISWQKESANGWTMYAALGKKSRFPTLKELYSERLGRTIPNPDLRAEHAYKAEAGIKIPLNRGIIQLALFYNELHDLILYKELGQGTRQLQNIGKGTITGGECVVQSRLNTLHLMLNYTYLYARNHAANRSSNFLPNRPEHRVSFLGRWDIWEKIRFSVESILTANQYYENPDNLRWEKLNNYAVFNLKLNVTVWTFVDWYIRANNISDTNYETDYGVPMPGRTIITGIRLRI